jgi:hypothetical protein
MIRRPFGAAALAALLAVSFAASGCLKRMVYKDGAVARVEYYLVNPSEPKGLRDRFVRFQAKRDAAVRIEVLPFFVYEGPFEINLTGGISDPELIGDSLDGVSCFELFEQGFFGDLAHTIDLCGRYTAGGYQVFNSENADDRFYPGVSLLDLRIVYDGANVTFESRPKDTGAFDVVTTFAFDYTAPLIPSAGIVNYGKGGVYDLLSASWTTTMPADTTVEQGCGWHIQEAYGLGWNAYAKLDGGSPDFTGAAADLAALRAEVVAGYGLTASFIDPKIGKQVARYLVKADRAVLRAQEEVADQDADGAIGQLFKSTRFQGLAFQKIFDLDFKAQF